MSIDNCSLIIDNCKSTGKGVKVAVIDSGINKQSSSFKNVKKSTGIGYKNDKIFHHKNINDENGHGTKICEIMLSIAPDVELYIAKIFEKRLIAEVDCLVEGIEWAIKNKVNVINVSLGTTSTRDIKDLKRVCEEASKKNIFIVSSLDNRNKISYPGFFSNVVCVYNSEFSKIKTLKKYMLGLKTENHRCRHNSFNSFIVPIASSYVAKLFEIYRPMSLEKYSQLLQSLFSSKNEKDI